MSKRYREPEDTSAELSSDPESLELPSLPAPVAKLEPIKTLETKPQPIKEYLALRVYATLAGPKWDQMAGFVSHAKRAKLGPLTMEDWQAEFKKFQAKPVG